jgi:hypothetical protein
MRKAMALLVGVCFALAPLPKTLCAMKFATPIIVDHQCADLAQIPLIWIQSVQDSIKLHYGHQSHGWQLTHGADIIEFGNPAYADSAIYKVLPVVADYLCLWDDWDMLPDEYWSTAAGMNSTRNALRNNPTINVSMFCWCNQLDGFTASYVQAYLDSMSTLEAEFPNVTFVYMTGNANSYGWEGYNRYLRNEQIRQYCAANDKVLYDFADLDSWWFDPDTQAWEQATYDYEGTVVPVQDSNYVSPQCDICGHSNRESCIQKGKALWWLLVSIAGYRNILTGVEEIPIAGPSLSLQQNFPNPFNGGTSIGFTLSSAGSVELQVFTVAGQLVTTIISNGYRDKGAHSVRWNGRDRHGRIVPNGIYLCRLKGPDGTFATRKMIKLR